MEDGGLLPFTFCFLPFTFYLLPSSTWYYGVIKDNVIKKEVATYGC